MIEAAGLTKYFARRCVVSAVSFRLAAGEIVAFLGVNGAGKTTTMRLLTGYLAADAGEAKIGGISVRTRPRRARALLGYLPEGAPNQGDLTARQTLFYAARLHGLDAPDAAAAKAAADAAIEDVLDYPAGALSKGYRCRLALAAAIIHDPPVLILDEPTDGLDPVQKTLIRALISRKGKEGKSILLSTHNIEEAEALCSRALFIAGGVLREDIAPLPPAAELAQRFV